MKKWHIGAVLAIAILVTLGATTNNSVASKTKPDEGFKNLKVLPKDISEKQLDSVMHEFSISLGVHCNFCHARNADSTIKKMDFASDAKDAKNTARYMYKMTADLNANYFNWNKSTRPDTIHYIVCYTCHRGANEPDAQVFLHQIDSIEKQHHKGPH
jgi:hypothetical protein